MSTTPPHKVVAQLVAQPPAVTVKGSVMAETDSRPAGRGKMAAVAAGAVLLGVCMVTNDLKGDDAPPRPAAAQSAAPAQDPNTAPGAGPTPPGQAAVVPSPAPAGPSPMKESPPLRVRIPSIKVDAPVIGLGLTASGTPEVPPPTNPNLAGWYKDGTAPGARGAAVVIGHVDTKAGPAVFWNLGGLKPGEEIAVDRLDGKTATFRIDSVESFAKDAFPDARVYGRTPDAQLRLITCGGEYDKKRKDYLSNVVVFAHLVAAK
jgi:LPXTG-site transpeptidase (sortase) family protein